MKAICNWHISSCVLIITCCLKISIVRGDDNFEPIKLQNCYVGKFNQNMFVIQNHLSFTRRENNNSPK